jgi:hypothetical protein
MKSIRGIKEYVEGDEEKEGSEAEDRRRKATL